MSARRTDRKRPSRQERREEILRPSAYLGYDRDSLAVYLMTREAYGIAELQFRRAVRLNPFEPAFKVHLAYCLYRQDKLQEAEDWARKALEQNDLPEPRHLLERIRQRLRMRDEEEET